VSRTVILVVLGPVHRVIFGHVGAKERLRRLVGERRKVFWSIVFGGSVLVEGTPSEIAADPRVREVYLGKKHHG